MKFAVLIFVLLAGCSSSPFDSIERDILPVTDIERDGLTGAGFVRYGGRTWRSETIWRKYIHTCQALYDCDIICSGGRKQGRRYAVIVFRWEGGRPKKIFSTHGGRDGYQTLHEAVATVHHQIERFEHEHRRDRAVDWMALPDSLRPQTPLFR
jgi:hypothetical protein